jgi:hypothetical protein
MPYTIKRSNGTQVAIVADGTVDSTLDINLIGKNYAGYGEIQNENMVYLLENFSNTNQPGKPISGQIWYDSGNKKLKFFDGSKFRTTGGAEVGVSEPVGLTLGDFWFDTGNKQLYAYNGVDYTLIGPQSAGTAQTEMVSRLVVDTLGGSHPIIAAYVGGLVIFIISSETSTFTLKDSVNAIAGFTDIHPGITLANTNDPANPGQTTPPRKFYGTASNSDKLGGISAGSFVRSDVTPSFSTQVNFADVGYTVGLPTKKLYVSINPDGFPEIRTTSTTMLFQTTSSGTKTPIKLVGADILPGADGISSIGSNTFKYATIYANMFQGTAAVADAVNVAGNARTASTASAANTLAVRDASANISANIFQGVASSAQYADLAEKYLADADYEVGTVVCVGGEKEVTAAVMGSIAIGIVSGNPAYLMNKDLAGGTAIALKGRVPCKVEGPVAKGDPLIPCHDGCAKVDTGSGYRQFAIALESSDDAGVKLVEVLVL